jgi:hypothetical protein
MTLKRVIRENGRTTTLLDSAAEIVIWERVAINGNGVISDGDNTYARLTGADGNEVVIPLNSGQVAAFVMNDAGATVHSWRCT